jgi:glycosyltransferase involved in cell wall biosynthesis
MNWLIVEDALRDRKGHWLEYVSTFVRGLTALGDEVVVLCDRKAQGFVMEQTRARPVLPESIWHRMGDGAGAAKRYLRVPGHAIATFFAIRKVCRGFNHEKTRKDTKGEGEKAESGNAEKLKLNKESTEEAGLRLAGQAGAAFSNPFASELARDSENTSLISSADNPSSLPATSHPQPDTAPEAQALDTGRWSLDSGEAPDWIFVPTVLVHHLLGWWLLLKTGSVPKKARVLLFFPNLPIRLDEEVRPHWTGGPTTRLMAWLFASLRKEVEGGRVVLGVETHAMRRALEGLIQMPVTYLPHPVEAVLPREENAEKLKAETLKKGSPAADSGLLIAEDVGSIATEDRRQKIGDRGGEESKRVLSSAKGDALDAGRLTLDTEASASPIVFGCYGAARWEKGSDVLQAAIRLVLQEKPEIPVNFVFQWLEDFKNEHGLCVSLDPWMREHPKVEVVERYFNEGEIHLRLAETDVMVLPYRKPYRLRVSRVVIEAMLNGMPVIATEDTTLLEQANEHGCGLACQEGSAESLARAILQAAANSDLMQRVAKEKAPEVQSNFSVDRFRQLLMNQTTKRQRQ